MVVVVAEIILAVGVLADIISVLSFFKRDESAVVAGRGLEAEYRPIIELSRTYSESGTTLIVVIENKAKEFYLESIDEYDGDSSDECAPSNNNFFLSIQKPSAKLVKSGGKIVLSVTRRNNEFHPGQSNFRLILNIKSYPGNNYYRAVFESSRYGRRLSDVETVNHP